MILFLYAFKDKKLGSFTQIFTDNIDPDKEKVVCERTLKRLSDVEKLKAYSDIQIYYLGTFDDESGQLKVNMPDFVIDAGDIVYQILSSSVKEEVVNNEED